MRSASLPCCRTAGIRSLLRSCSLGTLVRAVSALSLVSYLLLHLEALTARVSFAAPGKCGPSAKRNIDDVGFLVRVIDLCLDTYPLIDRRRVFVAGHSNGGMMAYRLAASVEGSRRIAAIAPVAGCACLPPTLFQPTRAVPVLHIHSVVRCARDLASGLELSAAHSPLLDLVTWIGRPARALQRRRGPTVPDDQVDRVPRPCA